MTLSSTTCGTLWQYEQILRNEQNPAHSGHPVQQDVWHFMAVSSSQKQDDCATREEKPAHTDRPAQQDAWHLMAVSISQEQDDCATEETSATMASLLSESQKCTCEHVLES